jgi:hypothetical protein
MAVPATRYSRLRGNRPRNPQGIIRDHVGDGLWTAAAGASAAGQARDVGASR